MTEFLTTQELAKLLRVKERKVYDLVGAGALPVRRVTGKLLFPKREIEDWIAAAATSGEGSEERAASQELPAIITGGHDPLLEWALRESRCGIAALMDGALDGLARMEQRACIAAGLHIPDPKGDGWNVAAVKKELKKEPIVLIEWAKRARGLMYRQELGRSIKQLRDIRAARFQSRQPEAGSELVLARLLEREGLKKNDLNSVAGVERSETDLALAIAAGRADVGLGVEAVARQLQLEFTPLIIERFDLLVWRKAYFDLPFQELLRFCRTQEFCDRTRSYGGYDIASLGAVHFNGP
jgi:putative molybdopterin biosynthesis protein